MRRPFHPLFWTLAHLGSRIRAHAPKGTEEPTRHLPPLETIWIPTRHGDLRTVVQRPATANGGDRRPPVMVHLHGGGFVNRHPEQDRHIARHLADDLGAIVLLPDYSTAPRAVYPRAEEEVFDLVRWVMTDRRYGWNGERIALSGVSAGAKLAINGCQQLHAAGLSKPSALVLVVPVTDVVDNDRTSAIRRPVIGPFVQRFVGWAYFPEIARRTEILASPRFDPALAQAVPATLVLTAEYDTLAPEADELVGVLRAAGVDVVHHEYPGADHGFIAMKPVETIRDVLRRMADFLGPRLVPPVAGGNIPTRPADRPDPGTRQA